MGKGIMGFVIFQAAACILLLTTLMLDFAGIRRRGTYYRWQGSGLLIIISAGMISTIAHLRGWSHDQLVDVIDPITGLMGLTGAALVVRGLVVWVSEPRRGKQAGNPGE